MELILNELSFDGQFQTREEFISYVLDVLIPMMNIIIEKEIPLLKKSDIYNMRISGENTLQDFLIMTNEPAMSLLKSSIVNLAYCEPYWDLTVESDLGVSYEYPVVAEEPNCFTEVIERLDTLISLPHPFYTMDKILCKRNQVKLEICNVVKVERLLKEILMEDKNTIRYILERYPFSRPVICAEVNGKCYAEEAFLENDLVINDFFEIVAAIPRLIEDLGRGRKSDLWDKLQGDIFEFRMHVSSNRIFRLLFVQQEGIQFLNGFIKKSQKTPPAEIDKAIKIKNVLREKVQNKKM